MRDRKFQKRVVIDIGHPANVHLFRYLYAGLTQKEWSCIFAIRDKEFTIELLKAYDLKYMLLENREHSLLKRVATIPLLCYRFFQLVTRNKPRLVISRGSTHATLVCKLLHIHHIVFTDTESAGLINQLSNYLSSCVLTGISYKKKCGKYHIRYPGYHELAYLHPNRFTPDSEILRHIGLQPSERYAIVRFVS